MNRAMRVRAASLGSVLLTGIAVLGANSPVLEAVPTVAPVGARSPSLMTSGASSPSISPVPTAPPQLSYTYQVEGAGVVEVRRTAGGLAFGTVTPTPGWTWESDEAGVSLSGTFSDGSTTLRLMIVDNDGSLEAMVIEVGSGDAAEAVVAPEREPTQPAGNDVTTPVTEPPAPVAGAPSLATPPAAPSTAQPAPTRVPTSTTQPTTTSPPIEIRVTTAPEAPTTTPVAETRGGNDASDEVTSKRDAKRAEREAKRKERAREEEARDERRGKKNDDRDDDDRDDDRDD